MTKTSIISSTLQRMLQIPGWIRQQRYITFAIQDARRKADEFGPVFSQCFEDLIIQNILGPIQSFIDIGANNGLLFSNTYFFAQKGAAGLCFEPSPAVYKTLKRVHRGNRQIVCINEAIANTSKKAKLYESGYSGLLSSLQKEALSETISETNEVFARPLSYWLDIYPQFNSVDLLSIDVEGSELDVIKGIDFSLFYAKIVVIEIKPIEEHETVLLILVSHGYRIFARNPHNYFLSGPGMEINQTHLDFISNLPGLELIAGHPSNL